MNWNDILQFARSHRGDNPQELALKARAYPGIDMHAALQQLAGYRIALAKLPSWARHDDIVYGPQLAMEQCSSQATALYKAALVDGNTLTDLTGGLGVDFSFMAAGRGTATYVERQEHLCDIARHNFGVLGLDNATIVNGDGVAHLEAMEPVDTIYIDPARRDSAGKRVFALADCTPDVATLAPMMLNKARQVIIKLSPMLDHRSAVAQLPCVQQVHIVSSRGECKEMVIVLSRDYDGPVAMHCINDTESMTYTMGDETCTAPVWDECDTPLYLYEPNASIMKAGGYALLANNCQLELVSTDSHLLVGNRCIDSFPGRTFLITGTGTMNKKELKSFMDGINKANVAVRNFPLKAHELAKRLKVSDGGDTYIFGTTTASGRHILIKARKTQ